MSTTSLRVSNHTASNIEEIGRHLKDISDGELDTPKNAALEMFVHEYVAEYEHLFDRKTENQYLYVGGDSVE